MSATADQTLKHIYIYNIHILMIDFNFKNSWS